MTRSGPPTRRLILATAGVALLSRVARAQLEKRHRIAILAPGSRALGENWEAFRQGLRTLGYVDRDIEIESRWADGESERLPDLAAELVPLAPEVIVVGSAAAALAARQATATIPIVVTAMNDPVGSGLVASLARTPAGTLPACPRSRRTLSRRSWNCSRPRFPVPSALPFWSTPATPRMPVCCARCSKRRRHREHSCSRSRRMHRARSTAPFRPSWGSTPMPSSCWAALWS